MLETFIRIHDAVNGFVWGVPAIGMILGVGLYLTLRTRGVQLRRFPEAMRETIGRIFEKIIHPWICQILHRHRMNLRYFRC